MWCMNVLDAHFSDYIFPLSVLSTLSACIYTGQSHVTREALALITQILFREIPSY